MKEDDCEDFCDVQDGDTSQLSAEPRGRCRKTFQTSSLDSYPVYILAGIYQLVVLCCRQFEPASKHYRHHTQRSERSLVRHFRTRMPAAYKEHVAGFSDPDRLHPDVSSLLSVLYEDPW